MRSAMVYANCGRTSEVVFPLGSALSLGVFHGAALPGGVFVPKTAVGHRAEAGHEKFQSFIANHLASAPKAL